MDPQMNMLPKTRPSDFDSNLFRHGFHAALQQEFECHDNVSGKWIAVLADMVAIAYGTLARVSSVRPGDSGSRTIGIPACGPMTRSGTNAPSQPRSRSLSDLFRACAKQVRQAPR